VKQVFGLEVFCQLAECLQFDFATLIRDRRDLVFDYLVPLLLRRRLYLNQIVKNADIEQFRVEQGKVSCDSCHRARQRQEGVRLKLRNDPLGDTDALDSVDHGRGCVVVVN